MIVIVILFLSLFLPFPLCFLQIFALLQRIHLLFPFFLVLLLFLFFLFIIELINQFIFLLIFILIFSISFSCILIDLVIVNHILKLIIFDLLGDTENGEGEVEEEEEE